MTTVERSKCPTCGADTVVLSGNEHIVANHKEHTAALIEAERLREVLTSLVWATHEARDRSWNDVDTLRVFLEELKRADEALAAKPKEKPDA